MYYVEYNVSSVHPAVWFQDGCGYRMRFDDTPRRRCVTRFCRHSFSVSSRLTTTIINIFRWLQCTPFVVLSSCLFFITRTYEYYTSIVLVAAPPAVQQPHVFCSTRTEDKMKRPRQLLTTTAVEYRYSSSFLARLSLVTY